MIDEKVWFNTFDNALVFRDYTVAGAGGFMDKNIWRLKTG